MTPQTKAELDYSLRRIIRHAKDAREALKLGGITLPMHAQRMQEHLESIQRQFELQRNLQFIRESASMGACDYPKNK
jgi:hypothetical protein